MATNRLYLFYPSSFVGWLLSLFLRDPFVHAAIEVNGEFWDSNLSRGSFDRTTIDLTGRRYVCVEFQGNLIDFIVGMNGRRHRWRGLFGWLFKASNKRSLYSFEIVWLALKSIGVVTGGIPERVSGSDLLNAVIGYQGLVSNNAAIECAKQLLNSIRFELVDEVCKAMAGVRGVEIANLIINSATAMTGTRSIPAALSVLHSSRSQLMDVEDRMYRLMGAIRRLARA